MIDKYVLIKAGSKVWSIGLQEHVIFTRDVVAQVTNTVNGNDDYVFGMLQERLWNDSVLSPKKNGDCGFNLSDTTEFTKKQLQYFDFKYEG